jgi:hypothetical protein
VGAVAVEHNANRWNDPQFVDSGAHLLSGRHAVTDDEEIRIGVANETETGTTSEYRRHVEDHILELLLEFVDKSREERAAREFGALRIRDASGSKDHQPRIIRSLQCIFKFYATGQDLIDPIVTLKLVCRWRPLGRPAEVYPTDPHIQVVGDHGRQGARDRGDSLAVKGRNDSKASSQLDVLSELEATDKISQGLDKGRGKLLEQASEPQRTRDKFL